MASRKNSKVIINPSFADFPWYFSCPATYTHTPSESLVLKARLVAVCFAEGVGEPLQTLVQAVTGGGTGGLDELSGYG